MTHHHSGETHSPNILCEGVPLGIPNGDVKTTTQLVE